MPGVPEASRASGGSAAVSASEGHIPPVRPATTRAAAEAASGRVRYGKRLDGIAWSVAAPRNAAFHPGTDGSYDGPATSTPYCAIPGVVDPDMDRGERPFAWFTGAFP
ncbi:MULTISPECIES: hypothetical protein [Streptomyces]|uniref:hypothetical protein n=1 Tax=Streptomyces TaxID=1883 RepID=UPI0011097D98|nr:MULTISPECIES: hypothetical protein [Streptomyces]